MCIGIPMRVVASEAGGLIAQCVTREGLERTIDLSLVGPRQTGEWVLTHQNAARDIVSPEQAAAIADALTAVDLAMSGDHVDASTIDALFPDLAGREPELPPHLRAQLDAKGDQG